MRRRFANLVPSLAIDSDSNYKLKCKILGHKFPVLILSLYLSVSTFSISLSFLFYSPHLILNRRNRNFLCLHLLSVLASPTTANFLHFKSFRPQSLFLLLEVHDSHASAANPLTHLSIAYLYNAWMDCINEMRWQIVILVIY